MGNDTKVKDEFGKGQKLAKQFWGRIFGFLFIPALVILILSLISFLIYLSYNNRIIGNLSKYKLENVVINNKCVKGDVINISLGETTTPSFSASFINSDDSGYVISESHGWSYYPDLAYKYSMSPVYNINTGKTEWGDKDNLSQNNGDSKSLPSGSKARFEICSEKDFKSYTIKLDGKEYNGKK